MAWGHPRAGAVGAALRTAFDSGDLEQFGRLLHPEVRWGGDGDTEDTCHSRDEVLAWYADLAARGVRAQVDEMIARDGAVVLGLEVSWPAPEPDPAPDPTPDPTPTPTRVYQVFRLDRGLVVDIRGYPGRSAALRAAQRSR